MPPRSLVSLIVLTAVARGGVVRLEMKTVPVADGDAHLPAAYEMLRGSIYGELNRSDRRNAIIQDIELAPQNKRGRVEYVAMFTLYRPKTGAKHSGVLVFEVVNRGASLARRDYSTGDILLQSGWQGDIYYCSEPQA